MVSKNVKSQQNECKMLQGKADAASATITFSTTGYKLKAKFVDIQLDTK